MTGRDIEVFGWHLFVNCHWRYTRESYGYRRYPNDANWRSYVIHSIVVLGLELSWWRPS